MAITETHAIDEDYEDEEEHLTSFDDPDANLVYCSARSRNLAAVAAWCEAAHLAEALEEWVTNHGATNTRGLQMAEDARRKASVLEAAYDSAYVEFRAAGRIAELIDEYPVARC